MISAGHRFTQPLRGVLEKLRAHPPLIPMALANRKLEILFQTGQIDGIQPEILETVDQQAVWQGWIGSRYGLAIGVGKPSAPAEGLLILLENRKYPPSTPTLPPLQESTIELLVNGEGRLLAANNLATHHFGPISNPLPLGAAAIAALILEEPLIQPWTDQDGQSQLLRWQGYDLATGLRLLKAEEPGIEEREILSLHQRLHRMEALHDISLAVGRGVPVLELAELIERHLCSQLPCSGIQIYLADDPPTHYPADEVISTQPLVRLPLLVEQGGELALRLTVERLATDEWEMAAAAAALLTTAIVRERAWDRLLIHNEELHRVQKKLLLAEHLSSFGELAAAVIHELNQPLNVLTGYLEMMSEGRLKGEPLERAVAVMHRAAGKMGVLVQSLREQSRQEEQPWIPVDLRGVVERACELTAGALLRPVTIQGPSGILVVGDGGKLEQVVINLLANALQAGQGETVVQLREDGDTAILEVADRGPGVPDALKEKIFEPFFTTKPQGEGTGLGLSLSSQIVRDHGGTLGVADNPGGGSIFRVILPRNQPA